MTSFLDLLPGGEVVELPGGKVVVIGVSFEGLGLLARRFPGIVQALTGGGLDAEALSAEGPVAVAAFIAAGLGDPGNEAAEAWAGRWPLHVQADLVAATIRQTVGGEDSGPFEAKLRRIARLLGLSSSLPSESEPERADPSQSQSTGSGSATVETSFLNGSGRPLST